MHVLQYRKNFPDQKGWRPEYKADLDITLQNVSQSAIDTATLCLDFIENPMQLPRVFCNKGSEEFTIALQPGHSTKIGWSKVFTFEGNPATGSFTNVGTPIVVSLASLRYSNGMLADIGVRPIGQGVIPSSRMLPTTSGCGGPVNLTAEMSAPIILDPNGPDAAWNLGIDAKKFLPPGTANAILKTLETITFQIVIGTDGSVCDVSILKDSLGTEVYRYRIEALKKTIWFPAIENGVPVTVRMVKSWPIEHTVSRF